MNAPVCPVVRGQPTSPTTPVRLPSIPIATDLPSLIRTVNIINDVLRSITTSLTVNNVWLPSPPAVPPTVMSPYPNWFEVTTGTSTGYVYNKSKTGTDPKQRAAVRRTDMVEYMDESGEPFFWRYSLKLDLKQGTADPFIEDFFERIVNVQWGGKLAVEFGPGELDSDYTISKFNKSTMAFWFRVPKSSLEQAYADWNARVDAAVSDGTLMGIVPLVTWGPTASFISYIFEGSITSTIGPSYIGVSVAQPFSDSSTEGVMPTPCLAIRFQSTNMGKIYDPTLTILEASSGNAYTIGVQDGMVLSSAIEVGTIDITPDEWHHLIVSFDISGPKGKLWVALDAKNHSGKDFYAAHKVGDGPNDITAQYDIDSAGGVVVSGGFSWSDTPPYGIPVPSDYSSFNKYVFEMAEFYLFTDFTLDTTRNAGAFFAQDKNTGTLKPAKSKDVVEKLGRYPDVFIHPASNWESGEAYAGADSSSKSMFRPSGSIKSYKPDPTLKSP